MKKVISIALSVSIAIFSFNLISLAEDTERVSPTLEKAIGQYKHENYDEALATLKEAREESPTSSLAAYYLGLTYKQMQDYRAAIPCLRDAVTYVPKIKGALIELVDCLYQMDQLEEAKKWIVEAETEGIRPAQISFLKGLVLVKEGDEEAAVNAFENAKALDPSMTQACDYQIGLTYLKARKYIDAKRALSEVVIRDPGSNMANFANEYMDAITKRIEATKPLKLSFGFAWQYDDNVVLQPSDDALVVDITDKGDSREVTTAKAEYEYRFNDTFGIKGQYGFYWAKQNDLGFYDTLSNNFVIQPSVYFNNGKSVLTFPTGYNHVFVNDKPYLSTPSTSALYNMMVNKANMAQAYIRYQYKDYLWDPSTDDEGRTGSDLAGGAAWFYFFAKNKGFLNLRYGINQEWTSGNNWEYLGNRVSATALVPVIDKLNLTLTGDMYMQNFTKSHTVYHLYRKDQVYTVSALAAYKIFKDSEIQLQYTFIKDSSNISVYDYNRSIYSAGVEIRF